MFWGLIFKYSPGTYLIGYPLQSMVYAETPGGPGFKWSHVVRTRCVLVFDHLFGLVGRWRVSRNLT